MRFVRRLASALPSGSYGFVRTRLGGAGDCKPLILEARVNEYAPRTQTNPYVPFTPAEIARDAEQCMEAGASIVHFHARMDDGQPAHAIDRYRATIHEIKARCGDGILIHPTLGYVTVSDKEQRIAVMRQLCQDDASRPDFAPVDMGTVNVDRWDPHTKSFETNSQVYLNPTDTLQYFTKTIVEDCKIKVYNVSWTIGFTRYIDAFLQAKLLPPPAFVCFGLTDGQVLSGHPGTVDGLMAHLRNIPPHAPIEWTVCNFGGSLFPVASYAIEQGGHLSIGLGDYPYPELGTPTNAAVVQAAADLAKTLGRPIASVSETKSLLGM